jgi:hypothetical protein
MAGRKAEANRIVHITQSIIDDLFGGPAERVCRILVTHIAHAAYDETCQVLEPARRT